MKKLLFILGLMFTVNNFAAQGLPDHLIPNNLVAANLIHNGGQQWPVQNQRELFFDTAAPLFAHRGLPYGFAIEYGALAFKELWIQNNLFKGACFLGLGIGALVINQKARNYMERKPWLQLDDDVSNGLSLLTVFQGFRAFITIIDIIHPELAERALEQQRHRELYFKLLEKWAEEMNEVNKKGLEDFLSLQERLKKLK